MNDFERELWRETFVLAHMRHRKSDVAVQEADTAVAAYVSAAKRIYEDRAAQAGER